MQLAKKRACHVSITTTDDSSPAAPPQGRHAHPVRSTRRHRLQRPAAVTSSTTSAIARRTPRAGHEVPEVHEKLRGEQRQPEGKRREIAEDSRYRIVLVEPEVVWEDFKKVKYTRQEQRIHTS